MVPTWLAGHDRSLGDTLGHLIMPRPSLEYEEEDVDDLFGSDDDTAAAHQATILASVNPARAVVAGPSGYRTSSERSGSLHAKVPSPSAKGKENARDAAPGPVDRLTRLEELRSRRSKLQTVTDGKGVGSLKYACMTGESTSYDCLHPDSHGLH